MNLPLLVLIASVVYAVAAVILMKPYEIILMKIDLEKIKVKLLIKEISEQLIRHEGLKLLPYRCPSGWLTIGVGRNLESNGISRAEAIYMLENDIKECIADLEKLFDWDQIDSTRKKVLVDMRFNLGASGFRGFKKMITAIQAGNYIDAAKEMKDSRWYRQVGYRAVKLTQMMKGDE